jgi:hypothetical protein
MVKIPLSLLVVHFIGDWLLQTNWQALNKSKNNEALTMHVLVYSLCFLPWGLGFASFTFLAHWVTDYFTSRCGAKLWFIDLYTKEGVETLGPGEMFATVNMAKRKAFWIMIGTDQLIHFVTLALTYKLVFGG